MGTELIVDEEELDEKEERKQVQRSVYGQMWVGLGRNARC